MEGDEKTFWQKARALSVGKLYVPFVVLAYGLSSLSGVFVNKVCLSSFQFGFPITLMLAQLLVSVGLVNLLRLMKILEISPKPLKELTFLFIPATLLILNVTIGLWALKLVNIPMFSALRRLSSINVMILEYYVLNKVESRKVILTVIFMIFGSFIAAVGDVKFDLIGYVLVFINNLVTGGNLVYIKKAQQVTGLEALSLFYHISLFALPICLLLGLGTGELKSAYEAVLSRPELQSPGFLFALTLSALSAFLINYTTNLCTSVTSALTTAITGQTKNILQTVLGFFTPDYRYSPLNLIGLFIALCGSVIFGYVKFTEKRPPAQPADKTSLPTTTSTPKGGDAQAGANVLTRANTPSN
mmetsp:Transcript_5565/g.16609  ORF Transcript_5565/g.16609 Transcript_5565/m.16609 type:complete len:358 (+) Transcript_5565:231-1304(+)|eukprot:CAMPEP_0198726406 /NCGR_PEP_ID=MMETSP1475-20131203/3457_1 /TAXON_ID= ORGANISM="Unidentified sp., Strain CCMP1999" /NCGR_SAMPLE_ID=MMETSP1475 /ASSEMBLY_ACC=CAM_ASM_001111 /LENGTH=357 /DNA_ID=CAMNT_0044488315 /DNA_START=216 /DNA_END=1289 /DNA_ORIENTATION=+